MEVLEHFWEKNIFNNSYQDNLFIYSIYIQFF